MFDNAAALESLTVSVAALAMASAGSSSVDRTKRIKEMIDHPTLVLNPWLASPNTVASIAVNTEYSA